MRAKGILFDLDDTIICFDSLAKGLWGEISAEFAPKLNGMDSEALFSAISKARKWFWRDAQRHYRGRHNLRETRREIVRRSFSDLGISNFAQADEIADVFSERRTDRLELFPGAEETLKQLCQDGIRLALITNGHGADQREKISKFDLERFFESILIEGEVGIAKPDPKIFRMALDELRLMPEDTWMVGDNLEWDIAGAQNVGIFAVWNDCRGEGLPADGPVQPNRIVSGIHELLDLEVD